jgi:outer membrane lipoprotein-sorting protein
MLGSVQAQSNPQADKVIKASQAKFDGLADVTADFTYTLSNPNMKKPVVKKGVVTLKKNKYKIVFADEEMYCNGKYNWVVLKQDEEIVKNDFDPEEGLSPDRLYKVYEKDMKSDYNGVENNNHKVTLFAKSDDGDIWKTVLWIDKETKLISKAIMYARNGSQYTYEMGNIKTNTGVADGIFNFDEKKYIAMDWIFTNQSEK